MFKPEADGQRCCGRNSAGEEKRGRLVTALSPAPLLQRLLYLVCTPEQSGAAGHPLRSIGWFSTERLWAAADRAAVRQWAKSLPKFCVREETRIGEVMRFSTPLSSMMLPRRIGPEPSRDTDWRRTETAVAPSRRIALVYASERSGIIGGSILCSDVTPLIRGPALGQVWMDHICFRPAAASGFRLTLKDGAEPSLGAPGPE